MVLDVGAWRGVRLMKPLAGGSRNEVWRGDLDGRAVAVRRSRRTQASLDWELDVLSTLPAAGVRVPEVVEADDGRRSVDHVIVQRWVEGSEPSSDDDWRRVAAVLRRLHDIDVRQRPGALTATQLDRHTSSLDADLAAVPDDVAQVVLGVFASMVGAPVSLIHGDPGASNIRIDAAGRVGLLDWDESRVDLSWHDLSNLGVQVLPAAEHRRAQLLSHAWETVNAWRIEPEYARRRYRQLLVGLSVT